MIRKAQKGDIPAIARLHELVLPDSIFVRLGRFFLERYYHAMLIKKAHCFSCVYEHKGNVVAFIAMTASRRLFFQQIKRDIIPLTWSLLVGAVSSPRSILDIFKAAAFTARMESLMPGDAEAELLQIAVHPAYRVKQDAERPTPFFSAEGVRIARMLFQKAMAELKARNVSYFRIMTEDSNIPSNKFYRKMGCKKTMAGLKIFGSPTSVYTGKVEDVIGLLSDTRV